MMCSTPAGEGGVIVTVRAEEASDARVGRFIGNDVAVANAGIALGVAVRVCDITTGRVDAIGEAATRVPTAASAGTGVGLPFRVVIATTTTGTNRPTRKPRDHEALIGLGQDSLAEILFLQGYQIGRSEFLHQREKVLGLDEAEGEATLILLQESEECGITHHLP